MATFMGNILLFLVLGVFWLTPINLFGNSEAKKSELVDYGIIVFSKGKVQTRSPSEAEAKVAKKGMKVLKGDTIITGKESFVIIKTCDNTTAKIDAESEIVVESLMQADQSGFAGFSKFILKAGGIMLDVVKIFDGPPSVQVKTRKGVEMGVRGTLFYVFDEVKTGNIWTSVHSGKVWVWDEAKDDYEEIDKDQSLVLLEGATFTRPQKWKWTKNLKWPGQKVDETLDTNAKIILNDRNKELNNSKDFIRKRQKKSFKKVLQKFGYEKPQSSGNARNSGPISLGGSSFPTSLSQAEDSQFPDFVESVSDQVIDAIGNKTKGGNVFNKGESVEIESSVIVEDKKGTPPVLEILPQANQQAAEEGNHSVPPQPGEQLSPKERANAKCSAVMASSAASLVDLPPGVIYKPECETKTTQCTGEQIQVCAEAYQGTTWYCCATIN